MNYRFLKNVAFDIVVIWTALIGGFYYGYDALENVAYFVIIFASLMWTISGWTLLGTKEEKAKRMVIKKTSAHRVYCRLSVGLEVLFIVAMGHIWLGAWYLVASMLMNAGCDKAIGDIEAMTND